VTGRVFALNDAVTLDSTLGIVSYEIARFVLVLLKNPVFTHLLLGRTGFKILQPFQPELPFNSRSEQFL
jgi:hypothetical protein